MTHGTVFPTEPVEAGEGGKGGDFQITNADFVAAVFPLQPEGAFAAISSKTYPVITRSGITKKCTGACGFTSRIATHWSSRYKKSAGISPSIIR